MFGTIVFENPPNFYAEYLLADESGCRVVACIAGGLIKLYRIEWPDEEDKTYIRNTAVYTLQNAIALFAEKALVAAEAAADAEEQSATIAIPMEDTPVHAAENGYECDEPDCICHSSHRSQGGDDEPVTSGPRRIDWSKIFE